MKRLKNDKSRSWVKTNLSAFNGKIALLVVLTVFSTVFSLAFAYLTRYLVNGAVSQDKRILIVFSSVLFGALFLKFISRTAIYYYSEKTRAKMVSQLRPKVFYSILSADYSITKKYMSGELMNRLTTDVAEVSSVSVMMLPSIVGMSVQSIGAVAALFTIDWLFTALLVFGAVATGLVAAIFKNKIKSIQKDVLDADGKSRSFMQEGLNSALTIKAYSAEKTIEKKAEEHTENYYEKRMERNVFRTILSGIFHFLGNFSTVFAVVWCGVDILTGGTDYGAILAVVLLLGQLQQPVSSISSMISAYYNRQASVERLCEIDDFAEEKDEKTVEIAPSNIREIIFKNVDFSYENERVFNDFSATFSIGKTTFVVGESGIGKSTLFSLILNVFEVQNGQILLKFNDDSTQKITKKHRDLFALVPQRNYLFAGTILENLTVFSSTKNADEIKRAIEISCADFIYDLPLGLDTVLGENGAGLSEGQLSRICIARAILSDRPIMLFDESTSSLDEDTENVLLKNLRSLGKTCIFITHRKSAQSFADEIVCIE